jgi:hypothetical protein
LCCREIQNSKLDSISEGVNESDRENSMMLHFKVKDTESFVKDRQMCERVLLVTSRLRRWLLRL